MNLTIDRRVIRDAIAQTQGDRRHVAVVVPADSSLDRAALLDSLPADNRVMWWQPAHERVVIGAGVAVRAAADSSHGASESERFGSVDTARLAEQVRVVDPYGTGLGPRLVGGFSFFADDVWDAFGSGELQLPELTYVCEGDQAAWVVVVAADSDTDPLVLIDEVSASEPLSAGALRDTSPIRLEERGRDDMREVITRTIAEIHATPMEKVVLARTASTTRNVDISRLVGVLADRYPECATFAFERNGQWFVGATPELLVAKQGSEVRSAALAATAPRRSDPVLDRIELESLRTSKQLEEHRLVVEAIVGSLEAVAVATTVEEQRVRELRHVRHLETVITGAASASVRLLDLVGALHPTPAVGGVPGSGALAWIRENELFTRGWYAAPVGVMDLDGNGEFRVALRSARIVNEDVHFYAGAGIVAGSDPEDEMAEIDLKLRVMAAAVAAAG